MAGRFQIIPGTTQAGNAPYDATANVKAAYEVFQRTAIGFMEWEYK